MINLDTLIQQAQDLEPLPASATRLAALVACPDPQVKDILEVVSFDQALTARLLRVANSAANMTRMPVKTVREAVVRLGNATVLALAVAGAVRQQMNTALPEYGFSEDQLWRHSVAAALAVDRLTSLGKISVPPEAFTAALLHDIGKLVLARFLSPDLVELLGRAQADGKLRRLQAETELLGVNHAELGGLVARRWGLPERIALGVQYHHDPEQGMDAVCDVVALANKAAKLVPAAPVPPETLVDDCQGSRERLKLTEQDFALVSEKLNLNFEETLNRFG